MRAGTREHIYRSATDFVFDKNWNRRQLSPSQRAMIGAEYKPLAAKEAKERQATSAPGVYGGKPLSAQTHEGVKGRALEVAAKKFGVGSNYLGRAERVMKKDARMAEDVKSGRVSLPDAERELGLSRTSQTDATMTTNREAGTWPAIAVDERRRGRGGLAAPLPIRLPGPGRA
jgi:hypothetical protein